MLEQPGKEIVELIEGSGVHLPAEDLDKFQRMAKSPSHLARLLFRELFPIQILATHQLYGEAKNKSKKEADAEVADEPLPVVDAHLRDTIFGNCMRCL